jgi:hypothetical protein
VSSYGNPSIHFLLIRTHDLLPLAALQIGNDNFPVVLRQVGGPNAIQEWQRLQEVMRPLAKAAALMPPMAFRWGAAGVHALMLLAHRKVQASSQDGMLLHRHQARGAGTHQLGEAWRLQPCAQGHMWLQARGIERANSKQWGLGNMQT